jgi:diadenosine tetraphosphate (Ap4A) HIT family hydrolase
MPDLVLRKKETYDKYIKFIADGFLNNGCNLCKEIPVKEFKHWKIIATKFPWSRIAQIHDMIIPKRHTIYAKLNNAEKKEYEKIKIEYIEKKYDLIAEATEKKKTIPSHLHIHLIVLKNKR